MRCIPLGRGHVCVPDVASAEVTGASGRVYRFEFDDYFGPTLLTKAGDAWRRAPGERHEFWPAFRVWWLARKELT